MPGLLAHLSSRLLHETPRSGSRNGFRVYETTDGSPRILAHRVGDRLDWRTLNPKKLITSLSGFLLKPQLSNTQLNVDPVPDPSRDNVAASRCDRSQCTRSKRPLERRLSPDRM